MVLFKLKILKKSSVPNAKRCCVTLGVNDALWLGGGLGPWLCPGPGAARVAPPAAAHPPPMPFAFKVSHPLQQHAI